jgi:hypothetical protein
MRLRKSTQGNLILVVENFKCYEIYNFLKSKVTAEHSICHEIYNCILLSAGGLKLGTCTHW